MRHPWGMGGLLLLLSCQAWSQTAAAPATFEVASIKLADPAANGSGTNTSRGRMTMTNMTLRRCILRAYRVQEFQLTGGPGWVNTQGFDINAKMGEGMDQLSGDAREERLREMLRSLLADRFNLVLRHEAKVLPAYALTVAKGGLKLKPVEADGNTSTSTGSRELKASKISMAQLATMLSGLVSRPVVDMTEAKGVYNLKLEWTPDDQASGKSGNDLPGPSIFTALQEQLGLKLESHKTPVELLVIERAERPTDN